jgi:hypothetical protein
LKLVEENSGKTLEDRGISNTFLNRTFIPQERERIHERGCIKLKSFCTAKEKITQIKRQPIEWEKNHCQLFIRYRLIFKIYKEL